MSDILDGREVKKIYFPVEADVVSFIEPGEGIDKMVYCTDDRGEYGIDWVRCYKDGKLVEQHNAKYLESVEFVREEDTP